jgi:hypothetical protein
VVILYLVRRVIILERNGVRRHTGVDNSEIDEKSIFD